MFLLFYRGNPFSADICSDFSPSFNFETVGAFGSLLGNFLMFADSISSSTNIDDLFRFFICVSRESMWFVVFLGIISSLF